MIISFYKYKFIYWVYTYAQNENNSKFNITNSIKNIILLYHKDNSFELNYTCRRIMHIIF